MKILKRLLIVLFVLIVLLLGAAVSVPYLFKDELIARLKEEINKTVHAKVDFGDVNLSLLRSFPNLSLRVKDYSVEGMDEFEGIKLAAGESADFTIDVMSVIKSDRPVRIESVHLRKPEVRIFVLENGKANYDISKPPVDGVPVDTTEKADYSKVVVELQQYSISEGNILYDDRSIGIFLDIKNMDHSGSGNFTIDVYDLVTQSEIGEVTYSQGAFTYIDKAKATLDAIFNIDQKNSKYTLKENNLVINALQLVADGYVQLRENDDIEIDLSITTPQNEFKHLLSMVPNAYIQGYEDVKANGQFDLDGQIKGVYNGEKEQYPSFNFNISVDNADVKYPDLPLGIADINAKMNVNSPSSDLDDMEIDVSQFSIRIGQNPFQALFNLKTPISDPDVKADINGKIDLEELSKAFPVEGMEELNGLITANVRIGARMSDIDAQRYEKVDMAGDMRIQNMRYQASGMPKVHIKETQMDFTPKHVALKSFDAKLGRSDVQASGTIDNILAYFSPEKTMKGKLRVRSNLLDANEWMPEEEEAQPTPVSVTTGGVAQTQTESTAVFDRFDFSLDAAAKEVVYADYKLKNAVAVGNIKPNRLVVSNLAFLIGDSDLEASGVITNLFDYLFDNGVLGGNIRLKSDLMNLNQFMATEESSSTPAKTASASSSSSPGSATASSNTEEVEPIVVPKNIDMDIDAEIGKVLYTNLTLNDVTGRVVIQDQSVILDNTRAKALGGEIVLSGGYETKDPDNPAFNLKYDLRQISFQQAFNALNTFQKLAPIGKYIEGNFNSSLIMDGNLGKDLMPKLNSVTAQGFLETINSVVKNYKPLQSIGNTLNIREFTQNIKLENTKNWFEIKNGIVELKEFDSKIDDILLTIGGTHGLDQEMNYQIKAQVPREMLERNPAGAAAAAGLSQIQKEAARFGIKFEQSKFVNVLITLTGNTQNPKVGVKLLGADGEMSLADAAKQKATDELGKQKEALQQEADKKLQEGKDRVQKEIGKVADSLSNAAQKELEKTAKEATDKLGKELGKTVDSTAQKKAEEALGTKGKEAVDDIKSNLEKFNPFGKKKKEDEKKGGN